MPVTDPVADLLTRIRNANRANLDFTDVPTSKFALEILRIFRDQGFIRGFEAVSDAKHPMTRVQLKYLGAKREKVITDLQRVSRPGLRVYKARKEIPSVLKGLGVAVISTPKGLLTDREAREAGVGGEVVCSIW